ncbi:hypothetical protein, partial [Staphylococcus hominis]|uniref:hypothetical protein n=1 Tax=Staphylococcus hominis TaxID=1290 RepID=UPI001C92DE8E
MTNNQLIPIIHLPLSLSLIIPPIPIPLLLPIPILPIPSFIPPPTLPHIIIPPTNSTHPTLFILPPPIPIPLIAILI